MPNPLIRKLEHGAELTDEDRRLLDVLCGQTRQIAAGRDIITEDEKPDDVHLVVEGWACRYKLMPDGRRQIMAFLVPGDFCDLHVAILGEMDHSIGTSAGCTIVDIPQNTIHDIGQSHHRIMRAMWWSTLTDEGTLREWLANMGQRQADRQMAHLFCELLVRLQVVGCADADSFTLPITQTDLADTLGISAVHVNRVLQELRTRNLVSWQDRRLRILDVPRLKAFCAFDPKYLHLKRSPADARSRAPAPPI